MNTSQPTKVIPRRTTRRLDLDLGNRRMAIGLNLVALLSLFIWAWFFVQVASWLRPALLVQGANPFLLSSLVSWPILLGVIIGVLLLHELVHGLFFWLFTRERPRFGVGLLHAYAAAPDWYLPRDQFIIVGLAPLLVLSIAGILLMLLLPITTLPALILALTLNAAGAVGDLYVFARLLPLPRTALAQDTGPAMSIYTPVSSTREPLEKRWRALLGGFGVDTARSEALFTDLCTRYTSNRHYHNLEHILQIHEMADRYALKVHNRPALDLAIWYHDIIYDPAANDNEAQSAAYLQEVLQGLVPHETLALAAAHIEATTHDHVPDDPDARLLLDLDLASFANTLPNYRKDVATIREEFAAVPADQYRVGRRQILNRFLDRPRVFLTEPLAHLEDAARGNIQHELDSLQA